MTALNPNTTCADCSNCLAVDYGYSNWTVEGTTIVCMAGAHPKREFNRWYGKNEEDLHYSRECSSFHGGGCHELDVDREDLPGLPLHVREFVATHEGEGWGE